MFSFYWENDFSLGFQPFRFFHSALELEMVLKQARKSPLGKEAPVSHPSSGEARQRGYLSTLCGFCTDDCLDLSLLAIFPEETLQECKFQHFSEGRCRTPGSAGSSPKTMFSSFSGYSYSAVFGLPAPWWRARGHLDFCFKSCEIDSYLWKQLLGLFFASPFLWPNCLLVPLQDRLIFNGKSKLLLFFPQLLFFFF